MGRIPKPPHPIEKQIEQLAAINCTWVEIEAVTGIPERTAKRKYGALYKKGNSTGKSSLKRKMWETAMGGNVTMMIWLSKQLLGYTDKMDQRLYAELLSIKQKIEQYQELSPEQKKKILSMAQEAAQQGNEEIEVADKVLHK